MMEATGRKPKTKPPAPTERDDDEGQPPDVQPISEDGYRVSCFGASDARTPGGLRMAIVHVVSQVSRELPSASSLSWTLRRHSTFFESRPARRLQGSCSGWYSIRINDEWRLWFHSVDGDAHDAEIVDYH